VVTQVPGSKKLLRTVETVDSNDASRRRMLLADAPQIVPVPKNLSRPRLREKNAQPKGRADEVAIAVVSNLTKLPLSQKSGPRQSKSRLKRNRVPLSDPVVDVSIRPPLPVNWRKSPRN